jgi:hypothetical protein
MSSENNSNKIRTLNNVGRDLSNIEKNNTTIYNLLKENTNKYLGNNFNSKANNAKSIKDNFYKYVKILKLLYEYNIHYENLLKKYEEQDNILLKKRPITDNEGTELNSIGIRKKILEILVKQKRKIKKIFDKIETKIRGNFTNLTDKDYSTLVKAFSTSNHFNKINFNSIEKNKKTYLDEIRKWIISQREKTLKNIDLNIKKLLKDLRNLKTEINRQYANISNKPTNQNNQTNNPNKPTNPNNQTNNPNNQTNNPSKPTKPTNQNNPNKPNN